MKNQIETELKLSNKLINILKWKYWLNISSQTGSITGL